MTPTVSDNSRLSLNAYLVTTQSLKSSTADEAPRGGGTATAVAKGFDFGLMIYFALWYLG